MSGEETNQAGQTPVDSHSHGERPGEVRPKTPSPTDIQERETIARIIDEEAYTFRPWNENWRLAMANRQQDALAKADTILALRSNPQPGSEGKPVAWRWRYDYPGKVRWTVCQRPVHPRPAAMGSVAIFAEPLFTASPTPPTAQPGEVERLREALKVARIALDMHADDPENPYPHSDGRALAEIEAALTPSESQEA